MASTDLPGVFAALRPLLNDYAATLCVTRDIAGSYSVYTKHIMPNKKPMYFGGVEMKAAYVSFHLMPIYVFPELLKKIGPELRKRMQGKSCFNFSRVDPVLFQELGALIATSYKRFVKAGYVAA